MKEETTKLTEISEEDQARLATLRANEDRLTVRLRALPDDAKHERDDIWDDLTSLERAEWRIIYRNWANLTDIERAYWRRRRMYKKITD